MSKIKGGYYLKARITQESDIAHAPPHVREIWDWLLKEANFEDTKVCKRGQTVRTYKDIQEGLHWMIGYRKMTYSKSQCENSMKWLKKAAMIATTKTTRGMIITIVNYDKYQSPDNYTQTTSATTKATILPQSRRTINKNEKNEKNKEERNIIVALSAPTPAEEANDFFSNPTKQEAAITMLTNKNIPRDVAKKEIDNFISYWTELNSTGTKERWQMEKTFELKRRITTWINKSNIFSKKTFNKESKGIII